ncbi:MAG TPA: hypothetical protein VLT84_06315 [Acidobacteriota bacterium]|nr:hypothetical protein [Acidobacteriota bacterium]
MPSIGLNEIPCSAAVLGPGGRFGFGVTEKRDAGVDAVAAKVEEPDSASADAGGAAWAGAAAAGTGAGLPAERGGTVITPAHFRQRIFAPCGGMMESSTV